MITITSRSTITNKRLSAHGASLRFAQWSEGPCPDLIILLIVIILLILIIIVIPIAFLNLHNHSNDYDYEQEYDYEQKVIGPRDLAPFRSVE